ncbi:MAG: mechanosensitive ion channel family protein [Formivibrio sp.]|nr:mechanosensitive ion channel family protein [Formivibrio sp.]
MNYFQRLLQKNTLEDLLIAGGMTLIFFGILFVIRAIIVKKLFQWSRRSATHWDDLFADVVASTHSLSLLAVALIVPISTLEITPRLELAIQHGFTLVLLFQIGLWGHRAIRGWRNTLVKKHQEANNGSAATNYSIIAFLTETVLWIILTLLVLDNFGFNITTLVASLGIGGIAIALAVQNILGDLFASLSISLDKPFVTGDFIIVDDLMGTVKHVGLKTTRIQSLNGEELVFSNTDLLKSRIRNYKRMTERRVVFEIGLVFGTTPAQLVRTNEIIRAVASAQSGIRLDRTHFKKIGASSLDFEVVYYVLDPDYTRFMDIQQNINLQLIEHLAAEGIDFAFPTQTLHIASMPLKTALAT